MSEIKKTELDTERVEIVATNDTNDAIIEEFSEEERKKIIRKVDRRLVTTLGFLYCVSLMDRTNLSNAAIAGMLVDLKLIKNRYNIITLVFFITYVLLQPPATVALRKIGPQKFLGTIVVLWGAVMIGFGFVKEWTQMVALRLILGVFEAGFFPSCAYLLSVWYPRYELQTRNAVFYLIGSTASAFSGILAYGFQQMAGVGNLNGWSWIFIIEGIVTILLGFAGYVLIVDFPERAHKSPFFLNEREVSFIVARIQKDRADVEVPPFSTVEFLKCGLDLKVWGFAACFGLSTTTTYAIAYFLPVILREGMGFSVAASQCLVAPPYAVAAVSMFFMGVLGDKYRIRGPIVAFNALLSVVGLAILGFAKNNGARYFGVFLAVIASNSNIPAVMTYQANNIRGQWKRAFCSATLVGAGGIGGIIGGTVFRTEDKPGYRPGVIATMTANGLIFLIVILMSWKFTRSNKRANRGGKVIEGEAGFRYTL